MWDLILKSVYHCDYLAVFCFRQQCGIGDYRLHSACPLVDVSINGSADTFVESDAGIAA